MQTSLERTLLVPQATTSSDPFSKWGVGVGILCWFFLNIFHTPSAAYFKAHFLFT